MATKKNSKDLTPAQLKKLERRAKSKGKIGRPSKFDARLYHIIVQLFADGKNYQQIADIIGVSDGCIKYWRHNNPNLKADIDRARGMADEMVEHAVFQSAVGYRHPETKLFMDKFGTIHRETITKHYPPDMSAGKFWLTNRRPETWSNQEKVSSEGNVTITLAYDPNKNKGELSGREEITENQDDYTDDTEDNL